jgi:hypothetical protein
MGRGIPPPLQPPQSPSFAGPAEGGPSGILAQPVTVPFPSSHTFLALTPKD